MVNTFETITSALKQKKGSDPGEALAYAANKFNQTGKSGSAEKYAARFRRAAQQMSGQKLDAQSGFALLQTILGGGQTSWGTVTSPAIAAVRWRIVRFLTGRHRRRCPTGRAESVKAAGLDLGDLMTAGMAFMQSKQSGKDNLNAMVDAFTAASGMGSQQHRQQSTQLVAGSFMQHI